MDTTIDRATQSANRRKRTALVIALLLLLLIGSTLAWHNYRQHKTNEATLGGLYYKATLVEEYDADKAKDWKVTDPELTKRISVLNPGAESPGDNKEYGDIYARIQLKEFMEFYPITQAYTPDRYMIDTDGYFIAFFPTVNYEITVGTDGWPIATETTDPVGGDVYTGQAAAQRYADIISVKADNGARTVAQHRIFFTPLETDLVANNSASLQSYLNRYNALNSTTYTLANITAAGGVINMEHPAVSPGLVDATHGIDDANLPYYIQTKENDPNGVYGNFITIDGLIAHANPRNLLVEDPSNPGFNLLGFPIPVKASADQQKAPDGVHDVDINTAVDIGYTLAQINGECEYTVHQWVDGQYRWLVNGPGQRSYFDYIGWVYGKDVVLASNWDGQPVSKWIIDDSPSNTEGWVYWGNPLAPGEQTSDFLTALALLTQSDDRAYYALHVDLQAVSYDELYRWEVANDASGNDAIVAALRSAGMKVLAVIINENPAQVGRGLTFDFTANVVGSIGVNKDIVWSINNYTGGSTIDSTGKLTVGVGEPAGSLTVRASSAHDPSKYDEWTVNVVTLPIVNTIAINPTTATAPIVQAITLNATQTFSFGASAATGVTWSLASDGSSAVNLANITLQVNPTNPRQAIVTVGRGEAANVGQTFKVVVTANDPDINGALKSAEAVVTVGAEFTTATVATTRYIPAARAGDTSDWIEIATAGGYSLMLRRTSLAQAVTPVQHYAGSTTETAINDFFNNVGTGTRLNSTAALRNHTVNTNALTTLGVWDNPNSGLSLPLTSKASAGSGVAFSLGYGEYANFCSRLYTNSGAASTIYTSSSQALSNAQRLTEWTLNHTVNTSRTSGRTASNYSYLHMLSAPGNGGACGAAVPSGATWLFRARPAVWIDAISAQQAGMFVNW